MQDIELLFRNAHVHCSSLKTDLERYYSLSFGSSRMLVSFPWILADHSQTHIYACGSQIYGEGIVTIALN